MKRGVCIVILLTLLVSACDSAVQVSTPRVLVPTPSASPALPPPATPAPTPSLRPSPDRYQSPAVPDGHGSTADPDATSCRVSANR